MQSKQKGFSIGIVVIALFIVLMVASAGYAVFKKSDAKQSATPAVDTPPPKDAAAQPSAQPQEAINPYEGMTKYTNEKFGFSFYHPADWRVEELSPRAQASLAQYVELDLRLRQGNADEITEQASISISDRDLASAIEFRDGFQTHGGKPGRAYFDKTALTIDGKDAVKYVIPQTATADRIWYVIGVGSKTYSVETFQEEVNLARSPAYFNNFNKVVESLRLP